MQSNKPAARVRFNADLIAEDMDLQGITPKALARRAGVSDQTVYRFLDGSSRTAPTAKKLARALRRSIRRYLITDSEQVNA